MDNSSRRVGTRQPVAKPQRLASLYALLELPAPLSVAANQSTPLMVSNDQTKLVTLSLVQAQSVLAVPLAVALVLATSVPVQVPLPSASPFQQILVKSKPAAPPPILLKVPAAFFASRPKRASWRGLTPASPPTPATSQATAVSAAS